MENSNTQFEFMSQKMDCEQLNEIQTINENMVKNMPFRHACT